MIKTVVLRMDTEKFRAFLEKTGGGEDFTGIVGLAMYDDQMTKDDHRGFHDDNGIEVISVALGD